MKAAGWEAVKNARALLAAGKVLSSNWTPPLLKGVVQEGTASYRAGLVIKGPVDIDNLCACRASSEAGIICAHNHPTGDPSPRTPDMIVTRQLRDAAKTVDIELLDHVSLGRAECDPAGLGFYSFRNAGLL